MKKGLSAFPLTPLRAGEIDENTWLSLIENIAGAGVDSIGVLGSTGSYAYLTREQRLRVTRLALEAASDIPVITSIGSVRVEEILHLMDDAQQAGVSGVLMAPVSYQRLNVDEVFDLYDRVTRELSVPLCIYDNPATTGFEFSDDLLIALSNLPAIGSIKLASFTSERIARLKNSLPAGVSIGVSGDGQAASGLLAGGDVWYSVLAGLFPHYSRALANAALTGDHVKTRQLDSALQPLWAFYQRHGSLRVIATVAEMMGKVSAPCLPFPVQTLKGEERLLLQETLSSLSFLD